MVLALSVLIIGIAGVRRFVAEMNAEACWGGGTCRLTNRWSGRVINKVPSSYIGARAAQLNR